MFNHKTPWYLSEKFFGIFFSSVLFLIVASFLIQAAVVVGGVIYAKDSGGVIPAMERLLCGSPGCFKNYQNK